MTKDQIKELKTSFPSEYETVIDNLYDWPTSGLVQEIVRWMPKSEFMKLINQVRKAQDDGSLIEYAQEKL